MTIKDFLGKHLFFISHASSEVIVYCVKELLNANFIFSINLENVHTDNMFALISVFGG